MNWLCKVGAKIILSRLPFSYGFFRRLGMFRHGAMDKSAYALDIAFDHLSRIGGPGAVTGRTCLELGPGDSLASAMLGASLGAKKIYLVDVGAYAETRMTIYQDLAAELRRRGYQSPDIDSDAGIDVMLDRRGAVYLTSGLDSLRTIETGTVDIIWSQAVLEHVRVHEIREVLRELRRIISPDGVMSHRIDYKDHLGGSLNNLRFPHSLWETEFMASSGFYTNRIRHSEFLRLIEGAGFEVDAQESEKWTTLPLPRRRLAAPFRLLEEDDLLTKHANVVARPKNIQ